MNQLTFCVMALCTPALMACADSMHRNRAGEMPGPAPTQAQASASYGVVQAIDQMQRQDAGMVAAGAMAAAAAGGITGAPTDKVYRVTVRMDDGSSQMVVVESAPGYKIGDRVRYSNGTVLAY